MLVHRILDAFFRTLDAVDAARDRVDRILGREPRPDPWAVEWPPPASSASSLESQEQASKNESADSSHATAKSSVSLADVPASNDDVVAAEAVAADITEKSAATGKKTTRKAAAAPAKKKAAAKKSTAQKTATQKAASKKSASSKRKGSVDRQGKDFDSPRARAVSDFVRQNDFGVVSPDAVHNGKKVLARVLWALHAAEEAGSEKGLTSADASALLHLAADIEVFATNLARACRDHGDLIAETEMDGRSKRYKLTRQGKAAALELGAQ